MTLDTIILTEPKEVEEFYPFSINHPIFDLRIGGFKTWERLKKEISNIKLIYSGRNEVVNSFLKKNNLSNPELNRGVIVVLSGNIYFNSDFFDELSKTLVNYPDQSLRLTLNGIPIGGVLSKNNWVENLTPDDIKNISSGIWDNFSEIELTKTVTIKNIFDAIYLNSKFLKYELEYFDNLKNTMGVNFPGSYLLKNDNILIGSNVRIFPGCVIDASNGPVIIDSHVTIMPQSTIIGPAYIGKHTKIKVGAKIYPNTSIGEWCKVGGEVEDSIIQGFSNKQHDGFLGHSFIGEWVNLGAGTDTSDLKNTYGKISVQYKDKKVKTDYQFLGFICGDYTKTAIGSKINSGTISGICSNIMSSGFPPKFIESFSWLEEGNNQLTKLDKALETATIVQSRREQTLLDEEINLIKKEFNKVNQ